MGSTKTVSTCIYISTYEAQHKRLWKTQRMWRRFINRGGKRIRPHKLRGVCSQNGTASYSYTGSFPKLHKARGGFDESCVNPNARWVTVQQKDRSNLLQTLWSIFSHYLLLNWVCLNIFFLSSDNLPQSPFTQEAASARQSPRYDGNAFRGSNQCAFTPKITFELATSPDSINIVNVREVIKVCSSQK